MTPPPLDDRSRGQNSPWGGHLGGGVVGIFWPHSNYIESAKDFEKLFLIASFSLGLDGRKCFFNKNILAKQGGSPAMLITIPPLIDPWSGISIRGDTLDKGTFPLEVQ